MTIIWIALVYFPLNTILERDYWVCELCQSFGILKNTTFRKVGIFRTHVRGWETPILFGLSERANLFND
jgi:hypothetical protein